MGIIDGHKILRTQPINPDFLSPGFPKIVLEDMHTYSPPAYTNRRVDIDEYFDVKCLRNTNVFPNLAQYRGNKNTPTALTQHYRWACATEKRLHDIQKYSIGFHVRHKPWDALEHQLPCSSCVVGQIKKQRKVRPDDYV